MATTYNEITNEEARDISSGNVTGRDALRTMGLQLMPVGAKMSLGAGTATVAGAGTAVKITSTTAKVGTANGFTVATTQKITADFVGTRLVRLQAVLQADIATGTDSVTFHIYKNGASVFETAAQSITSATPKLFEIDHMFEMSEDDYVEIYAENEDAIVNVTVGAYTTRVDTAPADGYVIITG